MINFGLSVTCFLDIYPLPPLLWAVVTAEHVGGGGGGGTSSFFGGQGISKLLKASTMLGPLDDMPSTTLIPSNIRG